MCGGGKFVFVGEGRSEVKPVFSGRIKVRKKNPDPSRRLESR